MAHTSSKSAPKAPAVVRPYIPASTILPEITGKSVVLGAVLSAVLAGANAYLGLKVGLTVSASIPAAVISMAVLRMFRESNILENNAVQTAASAGESLAAGVIFTLPALIMLDYWQNGFEFLPTMAIALCGGILGVLFTIPLRRALIIEARLQFPEGVATAEVLKAGEEGGEGAKLIGIAGVAAALLKLTQTGFKFISGSITGSVTAGRSVFGIGSDLGVALLAVGYIVGLNIAILVFAGGLISWLFGIPIYSAMVDTQSHDLFQGLHGYELAEQIWSKRIRYMGVGAMATGGLWALVSLVKPIRDGVRSSFEAVRASREGRQSDVLRTENDMPITWVLRGTLALAVPIFVVFLFVVNKEALGITTGLHLATIFFGVLFALFAGFLFSSVAGYMAGLVGSSNNPISGVTIATVLSISLILLVILGSQIDFNVETSKATAAAATAILVGGVVCCAAAIAGDNMQDLKAGYIVGATPVKQQTMQMVGVAAGAVAIAPVLQLLFNAYGLGDVMPRAGMDTAAALKAPQATLMSSVAEGVLTRNLPWNMIAIGVVIAVAIIVLDKILEARGSDFRTPVLAVAVGIYLPLELSVPIFIGGMVAWAAERTLRRRGTANDEIEVASRRGLLFASGLITGEALVGILLAIPFAIKESTDALRLAPEGFEGVADILGLVAVGFFCAWLYSVVTRKRRAA